MNGVDPKFTFWFGVLTSILLGVGSNAVHLPAGINPDIGAQITSWCSFLGWINTMILTAGSGFSSPKAGPLATAAVKPIVIMAVVLGSLIAFAGDARAQVPKSRPLTGNIVNDIATATGNPKPFTGAPVTDLQNFFNAKLLPDLQYALKLSTAAKNDITSVCYQSWIDIITTQQAAVKNADGTDIGMPDPHVITEFEKLVELRNALQPESPFMRNCSPVASMLKKDIAGFVGIVISGGAGLATLVPGL